MKLSDIAKLRKEEMAYELNKAGITFAPDASRKDLVDLLRKHFAIESAVDSVEPEVENDPGPVLEQAPVATVTPVAKEKPVDDNRPRPGDQLWSAWLKKELYPEELSDGFPSCDGLRRLFEREIGEIISSEMTVVQAPIETNKNQATVHCRICYRPYSGGSVKVISDVADCSFMNSKEPYCLHPSATAATLAEGRALRKGLKYRGITLEEAKGPDKEINKLMIQDSNGITDTQVTIINGLCKQLGIDRTKLLSSLEAELSAKLIDNMSIIDGQVIVRILQEYSKGPDHGGKMIPEEIFA